MTLEWFLTFMFLFIFVVCLSPIVASIWTEGSRRWKEARRRDSERGDHG